ncbi:hypothetical protein CR513_43165, partial [Mucuna pruriens]
MRVSVAGSFKNLSFSLDPLENQILVHGIIKLCGYCVYDLEMKSNPENINALAFSRQKVLVPVKVYMGDDDASGMEMMPIKQNPSSSENEDVEVNITGCSNLGKSFVAEDSGQDVIECSSSFGDTVSGTENALSFSDTEVESRRCADDPSSSMCDDWYQGRYASVPFVMSTIGHVLQTLDGGMCKVTKRVTMHWRRFIRPITWRCRWIELKLKQLQSQARKYEKELAAYNYRKQRDFAHLTLDDSNIKSVPMSGWMHRNKVMKRNKRKQVEEKCDLASYMSNHSLFSYYEKTDCIADTCVNDFNDIGIGHDSESNKEFKRNDAWSSVENGNIDKSLDDIIKKIEALQSQVQQLKTRTDMVIIENNARFCSVTQLRMHGPSDGYNHFDLNPTFFAGNGNTLPFSFPHSSSLQLQPEFHMGDLLMPENASASREGMIPCTERTNRPELDDPWENIKDGVLVQNLAAKEGWHGFNYDGNRPVERTKESIEEDKFISEIQVSEPDSPENAVHLNSTWNKTKRRKTSGSKRQSRRSSAEGTEIFSNKLQSASAVMCKYWLMRFILFYVEALYPFHGVLFLDLGRSLNANLLVSLTAMRAKMVAPGTKATSGMALRTLSWGTDCPVLLATMRAGGITIPLNIIYSSALLRFTFFITKSIQHKWEKSQLTFISSCFGAS